MKIKQRFLLTPFFGVFFIAFIHAQSNTNAITLNANIGSNGLVTYDVRKVPKNTFVFTLFGDGTFSTLNQPTHIFEKDTIYESEMFFVKAYDPNIPPRKKIQFKPNIINGVPNTQSNPTINMSGSITLMTSWALSIGRENYYIIAFRNTTSQTPVNGSIEFFYHDYDIQVDATRIKEYNNWVTRQTPFVTTLNNLNIHNKKMTWTYTGLEYNETRYIYIPATTLRMTGDKVNFKVKFYDNNSKETTSNHEFLTRRYPHDPNFKIVNKDCVKSELNQQQELIYTIGFFNDGENFAKDVFVKDELSNLLDEGKVTLLDYEFQPHWNGEREILLFEFLNIDLPGTNQSIPNIYSYDQASTYFSFKICTKEDLTECILNTASIVFDSQPTFYTNISKICAEPDCQNYTICKGNSYRKQAHVTTALTKPISANELVFEVYPNPASTKIDFNINFNEAITEQFFIILQDYSGKIIKKLTVNQHDSTIFKSNFDVKNLASGLYFMTLKTAQGHHTKKIIKH